MDRRAFLTAGALVSLAPLASVARADEAAAKKRIQATYARASSLMEKKDIAGLKSLMTADCVMSGGSTPSLTRDEWAKQMEPFFASASQIHFTTTLQTLKIDGKSATARVRQVLTAQVKGQDGKSHKLEAVEVSEDKLVDQNGVWLLKASKSLEHKEKLDGKPVTA